MVLVVLMYLLELSLRLLCVESPMLAFVLLTTDFVAISVIIIIIILFNVNDVIDGTLLIHVHE